MKKKIISVAALIAVFAVVAAVIIFELDRYNVIDLDYVPKYLEVEDLGSAKQLDGRTAFVSVFLSDKYRKWDFSQERDRKKRAECFEYTRIAADWLVSQGKKYGKQIEFCYAKNENDDMLYYEGMLEDTDIYLNWADQKAIGKRAPDEWEFIDNNIDFNMIGEKYGCDNIVYHIFINNEPENRECTAFCLCAYEKALERPHELCFLPMYYEGLSLTPAVIAHETLHTFGATDLYSWDSTGVTFGTTGSFVEYCRDHLNDDIMFATMNPITGEAPTDRIDREITYMTAYFIGWNRNTPFEIDHFKVVHSQFDKKK